jgi:hypothetical protein
MNFFKNNPMACCVAGLVLSMLLTSGPLFALTLKIGSIAPENSPWDAALRSIAREWGRISGGGYCDENLSRGTAHRFLFHYLTCQIMVGAPQSNLLYRTFPVSSIDLS